MMRSLVSSKPTPWLEGGQGSYGLNHIVGLVVQVDLSRPEEAMAEQLLDDSQRGAPRQLRRPAWRKL